MSISMYQASVPTFIHSLKALAGVLDKGARHAEAKGIDPTVLLGSRLYPDMFPLTRQVQIASDNAKGPSARLAGMEPPKFDDNEASFADLQARITKTIDFLQTLKPAQIDGSEDRQVVLQMRAGPLEFKGQAYLLNFALPNFYFHCATVYAILRHNGVEVGKKDFLGG
jgi:uncharacterized protein